MEDKLKKIRPIIEKSIEDIIEMVTNEHKKRLEKRNKNLKEYKLDAGDFVIIKDSMREVQNKFRPYYGDELCKVIKRKDFVAYVRSLLSGQIIFRHVSQIKRLNLSEKFVERIPGELREKFKFFTLKDVLSKNVLPLEADRRVLRSQKDKETRRYDLDSGSSDDEYEG